MQKSSIISERPLESRCDVRTADLWSQMRLSTSLFHSFECLKLLFHVVSDKRCSVSLYDTATIYITSSVFIMSLLKANSWLTNTSLVRRRFLSIIYCFFSVRKQVVNIPSFVVRLESQKHIDFSLKSPFGGGRPGRVKRKNMKKTQGGAGENDEEED